METGTAKTKTEPTLTYWIAERRNGYSAIDEYQDGRCVRTTIAGLTRKTADILAGALNDAYDAGRNAR